METAADPPREGGVSVVVDRHLALGEEAEDLAHAAASAMETGARRVGDNAGLFGDERVVDLLVLARRVLELRIPAVAVHAVAGWSGWNAAHEDLDDAEDVSARIDA